MPASPLTLALLEASTPLFESIAADAAITTAPTPHLRKKSLRRIKYLLKATHITQSSIVTNLLTSRLKS